MKNKEYTFRPVLFSTPMVQAILEDRKTLTRRLNGLTKINEDPERYLIWGAKKNGKRTVEDLETLEDFEINQPYGQVGDILWVRETFGSTNSNEYLNKSTGLPYFYKADITPGLTNTESLLKDMGWKWTPSIFMPKEACRIFLKVTDVRIERLQDISESDAIAEGVKFSPGGKTGFDAYFDYLIGSFYIDIKARSSFKTLWQSINGKHSWGKNPWVWVYQFKRVERPLTQN